MKKSRLLLCSSGLGLALFVAAPSLAQATTAPQGASIAQDEAEEEAVVNTAEVVEDASSAIVVTG